MARTHPTKGIDNQDHNSINHSNMMMFCINHGFNLGVSISTRHIFQFEDGQPTVSVKHNEGKLDIIVVSGKNNG